LEVEIMRVATLLFCFVVAGCARIGGGPAIPDNSSNGAAGASSKPAYSGYAELYSFKGHASGGQPNAGLTEFKGQLYGTTSSYGRGNGTIFAVSAFGNVRTLHQFQGVPDGAYPQANLVALHGALYGTTVAGGAHGGGTVFAVTVSGAERVVHSFGKGDDGAQPQAPLLAHDGVLYGTTQNGGSHGRGIVFALTPSGEEQVLHDFAGAPRDGGHPTGGLVLVKDTFYGTTRAGGETAGGGAVFKISPFGSERVIHSFGIQGGDGKNPAGTLLYHNGSLFGTTLHGGDYDKGGTVFEMTTGGAEIVLHSFGRGDDGAFPSAGLVAVNGELYGTTLGGGDSPRQSKDCISSGDILPAGYYRCGTIFKVNPFGQERVVYRFKGRPDGANPLDTLTEAGGVLYGTTSWGGSATYYGTIFRILP
jgi:uncharacterized repeat protein (TIGR03803 family)